MSEPRILDQTQCQLGEGAFWHPLRGQFFWFDIVGRRLMTREADTTHHWQFGECVSAAGWIDSDRLFLASETGLWHFDIQRGTMELIVPLEASNLVTRSNDGRADPQGGFWIGTMGKGAEKDAGAIYRFHRGTVTKLYNRITIPNAISFAPDGRTAYFTDTVTRRIMRQPLDAEGWPKGSATVFVDLNASGLNPDGAVVDAAGHLWNAQWGASRVARYAPDGSFVSAITFPARHVSCPSFGGKDMTTLFATSSTEGLDPPGRDDGKTFAIEIEVRGQAEHAVRLD